LQEPRHCGAGWVADAVEMKMPCIDFGLLHVDLVGIERKGNECMDYWVKGERDRERQGETGEKQSERSSTSLLPRPNPLMTGPESLIGNGGSGPESGPATGSRGPSGRIVLGLIRWCAGLGRGDRRGRGRVKVTKCEAEKASSTRN
jgi:hypothetical protein